MSDEIIADHLGMTLEDYRKWQEQESESKEAERLGLPVWEMRMMKAGASGEEIERKREDLERNAADAMGISYEDLKNMQKWQQEQAEAEAVGLEVWEYRMWRDGASEEAIDAAREKRDREAAEALGMTFEDFRKLNPRD